MAFCFHRPTAIAGACVVALAGCAAPVNRIPDLAQVTFACPDGLDTEIERGDGSHYQTHWLGSAPGDANSCRSQNGKGIERQRLYGRWDMSLEQIGGTTEEKAGHREAMSDFLSGRTNQVGFILRGRSGEQIAQHWRRAGSELLSVGGKDVPVDRINVTYIYAGNGRSWDGVLWYSPRYAIFVKSRAAPGSNQNDSWAVVRISEPAVAE